MDDKETSLAISADLDFMTDQMIGVAIAILQACFDDEGALRSVVANRLEEGLRAGATKASLRRRLQWIQADFPRANPSRSTLKRVNEFFLTPLRKDGRRMETASDDWELHDQDFPYDLPRRAFVVLPHLLVITRHR